MRRFAAILGLTLVSLCPPGTSPAQTAGAAPAPDTTRIAWARRLLLAQGSVDVLTEAMDSEFATQRRTNDKVPAAFNDTLAVRLHAVVPQLVDSIGVIYARELSVEDLKALTEFFQSSLGQRYSKAQLPIQLQTKEVARRWGIRLAMAVMKDLVDDGVIKDFPQ